MYTLIAKNHKRTLFLLPLNETLTMKLIPNPYIFAFKLGSQALHPWVGGVDNAPHRNMVFTGNFKFPVYSCPSVTVRNSSSSEIESEG